MSKPDSDHYKIFNIRHLLTRKQHICLTLQASIRHKTFKVIITLEKKSLF